MEQHNAHSEPFSNTREMVNFINERNIQKDSIVTVLNIGYQLFLIYFD